MRWHDDGGGVPHAPQPQRADHERSVSGPNAYPYLGYPEPARVGIGSGEAAVDAQDIHIGDGVVGRAVAVGC